MAPDPMHRVGYGHKLRGMRLECNRTDSGKEEKLSGRR